MLAGVVAFAMLLVFIGLHIVAIVAAVAARDGWHGWRHFWLS